MELKRIVSITGFLVGWLLIPGLGISDRIVLKDGTIEESDKIWTSDKFVHFILKGTQSVEVRYAIEIVDRVERDRDESWENAAATEMPKGAGQEIDASQPKQTPIYNHSSKSDLKHRQAASTTELRKLDQQSKGLSFYNPRRSLRYRISKVSAYHDLKDALNALAKMYGRSAEWVTVHMGEENDLQIIHQKLIARRNLETEYQREALPERSLSTTNDVDGQVEKIPLPSPAKASALRPSKNESAYPELEIHKGIKFYDPRRPDKYWTGRTAHHSTLKDALGALAQQYKVSPKWIEEHMGESNLLIEIHESIRDSLSLERTTR